MKGGCVSGCGSLTLLAIAGFQWEASVTLPVDLSTELLECPQDMETGFPCSDNPRNCNAFNNLAYKSHTTASTVFHWRYGSALIYCVEVQNKAMNTRGQDVLGGIWEAEHHNINCNKHPL